MGRQSESWWREAAPPSVGGYATVDYSGIQVCYLQELDGGGRTFGQDYIDFVHKAIGPVDRVFEWCAGPAYIGFSLLAHGLCKSLCLADINPAAVGACRETIRLNGLHDRVSVYLSDGLDHIPASESWDLVVGNPPHSSTDETFPRLGPPRLYQDVEWSLHRRFYRDVGRFLRSAGLVAIQENRLFSTPESFRGMIEESGLQVIKSVDCGPGAETYYYLISCSRSDELAENRIRLP